MGMGKVAAGQHCAGVVLPHNCSKQEEEECGGLQVRKQEEAVICLNLTFILSNSLLPE